MELYRFLEIVLQANEPTILPDGSFEELKAWAKRSYLAFDGATEAFLSPDEMRYLTIRKGSLDDAERHEIESHVTHTYQFLQRIPWTRELQQIPLIAYTHHEKMDGRGYPRRVTGEAIPIQTRMMTISDIYDALTAQDRPYKRAVSIDRALDILTTEVKEGQLDQKSTRLNSSHSQISYAVFCLKKKKKKTNDGNYTLCITLHLELSTTYFTEMLL